MDTYCRGLREIKGQIKGIEKIDEQEENAYSMVLLLGERVWQQQLYLALLGDLLQLPYLEIVSRKSNLMVKPYFETGYGHRF